MDAKDIRAEIAASLRAEATVVNGKRLRDSQAVGRAEKWARYSAEYRRAANLIESPLWSLPEHIRATIAGRIADDAEHATLIGEPHVAKILFALADLLKDPS